MSTRGVRAELVPFDGEPPAVKDGDRIEYRDAFGVWRQSVARGEPRYDVENAVARRCYLTVPIEVGRVDRWRRAKPRILNWPAEDVRPIGGER